MSWLFSQVLVEEYLGDISSDGEQSVPLSGNSTQQAYCAPDKMTKFSRLSRFGMTYKPLMESRGEELLTLYLADFHAKTLAQQGGGGVTGSRSSMWKHMARIIGEVRPQYVFVENSPMLTTRGLGVVLADLSSLGFNAKWGVVSAADVGANHQRERIWVRAKQRNIFSHTKTGKSSEWIDISGIDGRNQEMANTKNERDVWRDWIVGFAQQKHNGTGSKANGCGEWWAIEPNVGRVANGVAARVDRLKAIGNGQVPLCAATAWELLK